MDNNRRNEDDAVFRRRAARCVSVAAVFSIRIEKHRIQCIMMNSALNSVLRSGENKSALEGLFLPRRVTHSMCGVVNVMKAVFERDSCTRPFLFSASRTMLDTPNMARLYGTRAYNNAVFVVLVFSLSFPPSPSSCFFLFFLPAQWAAPRTVSTKKTAAKKQYDATRTRCSATGVS